MDRARRKVRAAARSNSGTIRPDQLDRFANSLASPDKRRPSMAVLRTGLTLLIGLFICVVGARAEPPEDKPKLRTDLYGDPLPEGAVARLGTVRFRHPGAVHGVAFSQDGKLLAASSDDKNMVVIWDRANGRKLREISLADKGLPPNLLLFSQDGRRVYGSYRGGWGKAFHVWDVETGVDAKDLPRPPAEAWVLSYSQDGREAILLHKNTDI